MLMKTKSIVKFVRAVSIFLAVFLCILGLSVSLAHDTNTPTPPDTAEKNTDTVDVPQTSGEQQTIHHVPGGDPGREYTDYLATSGGRLELPVSGASGYASVATDIHETSDTSSAVVGSLVPGECFRIISEEGELWHIVSDDAKGFIPHKFCFINLPDVIPSIVYNATNAKASLFLSSGKKIPGVSGEKLFDAYSYNERLGREEYIMPVLYLMAPKICSAQQAALAEGNTLVIYETFRPAETQKNVAKFLRLLADVDPEVNAGIATPPWSLGWFIATGVSNHQRGYAIDVTLAKVTESETAFIGDYIYTDVSGYEELAMPTAMHELSYAAACLKSPVSGSSKTAWKRATPAPTMNDQAFLLQKICTDAGMTPLASEWWHFNDLDAAGEVKDSKNTGNYFLNTVMSKVPE